MDQKPKYALWDMDGGILDTEQKKSGIAAEIIQKGVFRTMVARAEVMQMSLFDEEEYRVYPWEREEEREYRFDDWTRNCDAA